jgi:hypothetical protein
MTTRNIPYIQAKGHLLAYYHSDLTHIRAFKKWKEKLISDSDYQKRNFRSFLIEFRVYRFIVEHVPGLIRATRAWISGSTPDNVDRFAQSLEEYFDDKTMTSLASKVLFLNNPQRVLPIDQFVSKALDPHVPKARSDKRNRYAIYKSRLDSFRDRHKEEIQRNLSSVADDLTEIEREFKDEIVDVEQVRENRYVDKIIWCIATNQPSRPNDSQVTVGTCD